VFGFLGWVFFLFYFVVFLRAGFGGSEKKKKNKKLIAAKLMVTQTSTKDLSGHTRGCPTARITLRALPRHTENRLGGQSARGWALTRSPPAA